VADSIIAFSGQLQKIRLCLQTMNHFVNGLVKEDAFISLELQAKETL